MQFLRQSSSITIRIGPFVDDADGKTAETGLTITQADIRLSKNGGDFAQSNDSGGATHDEFGWYYLTLDATDTATLGRLAVAIHESGALPVWREFMVATANYYDSLFNTAYRTVNVSQIEGSDPTDQIRDAVVDDATRIDASALNGLSGNDPGSQLAAQTDVTGLNDPTAAAIADAVWDEELTAVAHNVVASSGRRLRAIQDYSDYAEGAVWIDTVNGAAGTTDFENGTVSNPVDTIADALTLAASIGLTRLRVLPGSSITFAATMDGYNIGGSGWTLALGGQSCSGTIVFGASVSGTCTGATAPEFYDCKIGTVTVPASRFIGCQFTGTVSLSAAGDYFWDGCFSGVAGTGTPGVDFGAAVVNTNLSMRHYSGGIEVKNIGQAGTDNMSLEGFGQLVLNANCAGGTIAIRGNFTVTDNAGGAVTLSDDARIDANKVADHVMRRTFQNACDSADGDAKTGRSLLGAVAKLVNKLGQVGSTLSIYEDDDTTVLFTQTVTTDSGADPITELDTA